ncbi:MAG TPA: hypothetical protein VGG37_01735 [Opitutaceae bacterium]
MTWPNNLLGYPDSVSHLIAASLILVRRRWLLARHALTAGWIGPGIAPVQTYLDMNATVRHLTPTQMSWAVWWGNVAVSYRRAWIVIVAGAARQWSRGGRAHAAALVALLVLTTASTIFVFDVAQSVAFTFLALPLALAWLAGGASPGVPRVAVLAAWLCIATPSLWVVPGYSIWFRPLPLRIAAYVTGKDPIAWQSTLR